MSVTVIGKCLSVNGIKKGKTISGQGYVELAGNK
jgi:hypothetical protein